MLFRSTVMTITAVNVHGPDSEIARAMGRDRKGKLSLVAYMVSVPVAFVAPIASCVLFVIVAMIWLVPDKRIEAVLK